MFTVAVYLLPKLWKSVATLKPSFYISNQDCKVNVAHLVPVSCVLGMPFHRKRQHSTGYAGALQATGPHERL